MVAAIVSTYAGGFSGSVEKTPQSSIRATADPAHQRVYFEHNGGDAFMLSSINVVLRSGDNKTSVSMMDAGGTKVKNFTAVGQTRESSDVTIKAGDTFYIEGVGNGNSGGIRFGSMTLTNNSKTTWIVVDKASSKTVSMGSFFL
jgi:hypothetical protein